MTRRQSNNKWSWGIAAYPTMPQKIPSAKSARKVLASIFWDQDSIPLIYYLSKGRTINAGTTHLCWCKWSIIWRKNAAAYSPRRSCSCTTIPRLTGYLQSRRNWPTWASSILITHLILRIWTHRTITCSLDWKKQLNVFNFSSEVKVIAAAETWLDGQYSEFLLSRLQKLEQRTKKCVELRGRGGWGCAEWIPILVAVAFFLPGRANDLTFPIS